MHDSITLTENGRSRATIVTAPDIGPQAMTAVRDMVRVIAEISGAAIPVVDDGNVRETGPQVHIGRTAFVRESGLEPANLPVNGYRIVTVDDPAVPRLVITGPTYLGISHGIYDLLTNELGVCWGMADPLFEEIPSRATVTVGPLDRTEQPSFGFRVFSGGDAAWLRRSRIDDGSRMLPYYGHGHNLHNVVPPDVYGDHPEYYALIDGERQVPEKRDGSGPQPCLTHPDVIRITVETLREFFDENPGTYWYTPGWIDTGWQPGEGRYEHQLAKYIEKYGEDNAKYLMDMESGWFTEYSNAAYVDLGFGDNREFKEFTRECARYLEWDYKELHGEPSLVVDWLEGNWDHERYLVVDPGREIRPSDDADILKSVAR